MGDISLGIFILQTIHVTINLTHHVRRTETRTSSFREGHQEGWWFQRRKDSRWRWCRQEEEAQEEGVLRHLHLQGFEAGPPRHWSLLQGNVHHEFLCQRHL